LSPLTKNATPTKQSRSRVVRTGRVSFIGAGPGDPELLTVRAVGLLAEADLVLVDHGLVDGFLAGCRADTEIVHCCLPSEDEARLLAERSDGVEQLSLASRTKAMTTAAKEGRRVVRLYRGDPGMDAQFAAEAAACAKAGVMFDVVPGIAPATAVPMYAGVPLCAADSGDVTIISAEVTDPQSSAWHRGIAEAGAGEAALVLLGIADRLDSVAAELIAAGRKPATPVSVTINGGLTSQRTVVSTLDRVASAVKSAGLSHDGQQVVVVGDSVGARDVMSWFETKPLFGWQVLVPRTKEQAEALSVQLRGYGAVPHEVPTIAVEPPRTPQQMERAVKGLVTGRYEWIAFTSANAVKAIREKFEEYGLDARAFAGIKVAAVGEQTARSLREFGVKPDLVPSGEQSAAGLLEDFPPYDSVFDPINRVFLPRADIATETLVAGLVELGWEVDDVTAYRTVRAAPPPAEVRDAIKGGGFDAVLFTSSSTVRNLVGIAGKPHATTVIACIGPATAKTAEEHGLRVDVLAAEPSVAMLAQSLADFGAARRLAAIEAGEPVYRPSERRSARARRAR
jgi:uroporphyrinogen III methyltransferase/synthase